MSNGHCHCGRPYPCLLHGCMTSYSCDHPMVVFRDGGRYCTECQQRVG